MGKVLLPPPLTITCPTQCLTCWDCGNRRHGRQLMYLWVPRIEPTTPRPPLPVLSYPCPPTLKCCSNLKSRFAPSLLSSAVLSLFSGLGQADFKRKTRPVLSLQIWHWHWSESKSWSPFWVMHCQQKGKRSISTLQRAGSLVQPFSNSASGCISELPWMSRQQEKVYGSRGSVIQPHTHSQSGLCSCCVDV